MHISLKAICVIPKVVQQSTHNFSFISQATNENTLHARTSCAQRVGAIEFNSADGIHAESLPYPNDNRKKQLSAFHLLVRQEHLAQRGHEVSDLVSARRTRNISFVEAQLACKYR